MPRTPPLQKVRLVWRNDRNLQSKAPDRIREIEMAVDVTVYDQGFSIQFWADVRLYGLAEACTYLENAAVTGNVHAKPVDAEGTVIAEVNGGLRPAPQGEGNGFDDIGAQ